jgi:starch synthase
VGALARGELLAGLRLHKGAITFADALIVGSKDLSDLVKEEVSDKEKPILDFQEAESYLPAYLDFYKEILAS